MDLFKLLQEERIEDFNKARKANPHDRNSLSDKSFSALNLSGTNLSNLQLYNTDFIDCDLSSANFSGAILDYTGAYRCDLDEADFRGASQMYKLDGYKSSFRRADLRGAFLKSQYKWHVRGLLGKGTFEDTLITPEQYEKLVSEFEVAPSFLDEKFITTPRGKYFQGPNQWAFEVATRLYQEAAQAGNVVQDPNWGREYAVIPLKGNEDLRNAFGFALSLCEISEMNLALMGSRSAQINGNGWRYMVFDSVPKDFREILAAHEFAEQSTGSHEGATIVEYKAAKDMGILDGYLDWVIEHSPLSLIHNVLSWDEDDIPYPTEVIERAKPLLPNDQHAWEEEMHRIKPRGLANDIHYLRMQKALNFDDLLDALDVKGYKRDPKIVQFFIDEMELPDAERVRRGTY
jgi:hypothetical protein